MPSNTISATIFEPTLPLTAFSAESLIALHEADLAIGREVQLGRVLEAVVKAARRLTEAQSAALALPDAEGKLSLTAVKGYGELAAWQAWLGEQTQLDEIMTDAGAFHLPPACGPVYSLLALPLLMDEVWVGNLYVFNRHGSVAFETSHRRLLEMLAESAASAICRARALASAENRNRQFAILNRATVSIARDLALDKVLQHIVDAARELVGARYAALGVPNADGFLETFVQSGMSADTLAGMAHRPLGLGLLGEMIRQRRSINLARLQDHPESAGFPPGHPAMVTFLGVPILGGDEVLGNLYLTEKIGSAEFSAADQEMVEWLAAHAAVAIHNARLYHQVERLAVLEERTRIGMDLHDGVIQSIYAVGLTLESTRLALADRDEAGQLLDMAISGLNGAIQDIRNYILDLRPRRFRGNLEQGLAQLVREFQANTLVPVQLETHGALETLPTAVARTIFLATQEALANVARHAKAGQVVLRLHILSGWADLSIADDGRGFNAQDHARHVGHGLANMQARAEELKGAFTLHTAPGRGTTISLRLPMR